MKVSELAEEVKTTPDTVRYYTRMGLLLPLKSETNGYKDYRENELHRLRFILNARQLGFSVKDISQILTEAAKGKTACPLVKELLEKRLEETEQLFQQTLALRIRMQSAISEWKNKPNIAPTGHMICHLIEGFSSSPEKE